MIEKVEELVFQLEPGSSMDPALMLLMLIRISSFQKALLPNSKTPNASDTPFSVSKLTL